MKPVGTVYFVRGKNSGLIKIGFSRTVHRRLANVRQEAGELVDLLAAYSGTVLDERAEHARFAESRVRGEWFVSTEALKRRIAEVGCPSLGPDNTQRDEFTARARDWVTALEDAEAKRLGVKIEIAREALANRIGVAPGTLFNLRNNRIAAIGAAQYEAIRKETVAALEARRKEVAREITETMSAVFGLADEPGEASP